MSCSKRRFSRPPLLRKHSSKTEEQIVELKSMFKLFDMNGDGKIESNELERIYRASGYHLTNAEVKEIMSEIAGDGKDTIDFEAFIRYTDGKMRTELIEETHLRAAFKIFDKSGNGMVTRDELREVLQTMIDNPSEEQLDEMLNEADKDENGFIDYDEFVTLVMKK